jgi:hypothetical protein
MHVIEILRRTLLAIAPADSVQIRAAEEKIKTMIAKRGAKATRGTVRAVLQNDNAHEVCRVAKLRRCCEVSVSSSLLFVRNKSGEHQGWYSPLQAKDL